MDIDSKHKEYIRGISDNLATTIQLAFDGLVDLSNRHNSCVAGNTSIFTDWNSISMYVNEQILYIEIYTIWIREWYPLEAVFFWMYN